MKQRRRANQMQRQCCSTSWAQTTVRAWSKCRRIGAWSSKTAIAELLFKAAPAKSNAEEEATVTHKLTPAHLQRRADRLCAPVESHSDIAQPRKPVTSV